ncbi:hypothetical protein BMS3Bbin10_01378 [bacterium BMS3Bbin10]|nr:hypothetical protein BMS3Bbin10_01378 [bacterium BMS3Bbin10]
MPRKPTGGEEDTGQDSPVPGEVYIEYKQVGQTIKVTAVDAATGLEVVIMGPASAAQTHLQKVAVEKLKMQLKKAESEPDPGEDEESKTQPPQKGWTA